MQKIRKLFRKVPEKNTGQKNKRTEGNSQLQQDSN